MNDIRYLSTYLLSNKQSNDQIYDSITCENFTFVEVFFTYNEYKQKYRYCNCLLFSRI